MKIIVGREYRLLPGAHHSGGQSQAVEDEVTRVRVVEPPDMESDVAVTALDGPYAGTPGFYLVQTEFLAPLDEHDDNTPAGALNYLAAAIHAENVARGWYDPGTERSFGDVIALLHSELSEALEEHRNGHGPKKIYFPEVSRKGQEGATHADMMAMAGTYGWKPEGIPVELADVLIRLLDTCAALGIDIDHAVSVKRAYNATRPHRHGGKKL
jgi:hypothetical protein